MIKIRKTRKEYHGEEALKWEKAGKTQGRKGCKMVRINMAFAPEIHDFIRTMARVRGESMTEFTNYVFKQYMEDNSEIYKKVLEFKNSKHEKSEHCEEVAEEYRQIDTWLKDYKRLLEQNQSSQDKV